MKLIKREGDDVLLAAMKSAKQGYVAAYSRILQRIEQEFDNLCEESKEATMAYRVRLQELQAFRSAQAARLQEHIDAPSNSK